MLTYLTFTTKHKYLFILLFLFIFYKILLVLLNSHTTNIYPNPFTEKKKHDTHQTITGITSLSKIVHPEQTTNKIQNQEDLILRELLYTNTVTTSCLWKHARYDYDLFEVICFLIFKYSHLLLLLIFTSNVIL